MTIDEPMKGFRTAPDNSRTMGFAGTRPEDAVKWAAAELKKIYG